MAEYSWALKAVSDLGFVGFSVVALVMVYRLVNRWAEAFLSASTAQTKAMADQASAVTSLASTVKDSQSDQRETLIAVRVQSRQLEDIKAGQNELARLLIEKGDR